MLNVFNTKATAEEMKSALTLMMLEMLSWRSIFACEDRIPSFELIKGQIAKVREVIETPVENSHGAYSNTTKVTMISWLRECYKCFPIS